MSAPQIIRTPGGEELVVLPRAEYDALLARADHEAEDADDVAIYDIRKAELASGGVVLPPEVSAAILRGESRLKAVRNWRGETQLRRRISREQRRDGEGEQHRRAAYPNCGVCSGRHDVKMPRCTADAGPDDFCKIDGAGFGDDGTLFALVNDLCHSRRASPSSRSSARATFSPRRRALRQPPAIPREA